MKKMDTSTCFFSVLLFITSCLQAAQLPKVADLVPPETVLLIQTDDFKALKEQFEKTSYYKLYSDPVMAPFFEKVKSSLKQEMAKQDDNNIYKMFYNTGVLPAGRVAVALVLNEQTLKSDETPLLFVVQWGENIDKIKDAVKKLVEKNTEMGGRSKPAEEYYGVNIETLVDENSVEFSYCFVDDCLIGSLAGLDALKFVVAHIGGADSPSLADQSDYNSSLAATGPDRDIVLYVNIKHLIKTVSAEDASGQVQQMLPGLGLDNVSSFCCSVGISRQQGNTSSGKALLKIEGDKKGICKLLDCSSAPLQLPRFIPSSTYSIVLVNLNIKAAFDELVKIVSSFSPQAAAVFYTPLLPAGPDGQPGIELKRDIIERLGSQIIITQEISRPITDKLPKSTGLYAVATSDSRALEKSLSELHSKFIAPDDPQARRELLGHTIYIIDLSSFASAPLSASVAKMQDPAAPRRFASQIEAAGARMAFTVTDTHLIVGLEPAVEKALRTLESPSSESLVSAKWFNTVKGALPSVAGLAALGDDVTNGEILWKVLKSTPKKTPSSADDADLTLGLGLSSQSGLMPLVSLAETVPFDFSLLPDFEAVKKYFGLSALYGVSRPEGFFFEFKEVPAN